MKKIVGKSITIETDNESENLYKDVKNIIMCYKLFHTNKVTLNLKDKEVCEFCGADWFPDLTNNNNCCDKNQEEYDCKVYGGNHARQ